MTRLALTALLILAASGAVAGVISSSRVSGIKSLLSNSKGVISFEKPADFSSPALPDPIMTPGAVDPRVTLADICNGTTRARRVVSAATRAKVLADYGLSPAAASCCELDHLVPLELGGSNAAANLWPQPWAEADRKDELEDRLRALVCHGTPPLPLAQAQREIAQDWPGAERRYMGADAARSSTRAVP